MDVLLLCPPGSTHPPFPAPRHAPHFTLLAAAALQRDGHGVAFRDHHKGAWTPREVATTAAGNRPDLILLASSDDNRHVPPEAMGAVAGELRRALPGVPVVAVGRTNRNAAERMLAEIPALHGVTFGEPDEAAPALARALLVGEELPPLPGLVSRRPDGRVEVGPDPRPDPASWPVPAWDLAHPRQYPLSPHQQTADPTFPLLASRGCPWPCVYCETGAQPRWLARPVEAVIAELHTLRNRWGVRSIFFADANFVVDRKWTQRLMEAMRSEGPPGTRWSCMARTDRVTPDLLRAMAAAGCWEVLYGVESVNPTALRLSGKRLDPRCLEPAIRWAHEAGIEVIASAMIGLPGDTPQGVWETVDKLIELGPDYAQFFVVQLPGSEAPEGGRFVTGWEGGGRDFVGRVFAPEAFGGRAALLALRGRAYRRFYLRPGYFLMRGRKILDAPSPAAEVARLLRGARVLGKMAAG